MILRKDCRYFRGDRPCIYHKNEGINCKYCNYYQPITFKILIIKLDAIGDVLRTTSILLPLNKKYPNSYITWCTREDSKDLFIDNSLVNEIICVEEDAYFRIKAEQFNLVINLDTSKFSSAIATTAKGIAKQGFILNHKGFVEPTSKAANEWLLMSAFDDLKKKNQRTYQQIIYDILELDENISPPIFNITRVAQTSIASRLTDWKFNENLPTVGLNIGVGTKWPSKGWPIQMWQKLIELLRNDKFNLLLLGGPEEVKEMIELKSRYHFLTDTDSGNSLMEFAAIVSMCDVIITADTLALHIATALGKKVIALFGPTSSNEIDLFGKGIKLTSPEDCKCYYERYCSHEAPCMGKITSETVYESLNSLLAGKFKKD